MRARIRTGIGGSGVGLSLVKSIADLHKGGISLTSVEGKGSEFTLLLPAVRRTPTLAGQSEAHAIF